MEKVNYIEYKGLPLVRNGDVLYYGDMNEKYMLVLNILSKKEDGEPDMIMVQICESGNPQKIVDKKQAFKNGLYESLDLGIEWLEHMPK